MSKGLNRRQDLFARRYAETLNGTQAAIAAGYSKKTAAQMAYENLKKPEIVARIHEYMRALVNTADLEETLVFLTKVMRGEVKDQFDLDAALSDRMKAAETLLRRFMQLAEKESEGGERERSVTVRIMNYDGGGYAE